MVYVAISGAAAGTSIVLWVVFLQNYYGFSLTQVTLLDLPFWIGRFIFEIPTGVVADRFGRRVSLAICASLSSVIWLVFATFGQFWVMVIAQFLGGLAATFSSGADEALLFESVKAEGRSEQYAQISGRARAVGLASSMLAGLVVAMIATFSLVLPVILTSILSAATLLPIWLMQEPPGKIARRAMGYSQILKQAITNLHDSGEVRWAAAALVIVGCTSFYLSVFLQPYTLGIGLPVAALGPVMLVMQLASMGGSLAIDKVHKLGWTPLALWGTPFLLVVCLGITGAMRGLPGLAAAALASGGFALLQPLLLAMVQANISDTARATLLSVQSMGSMIFLVFTEPALGALADTYGAHTAYFGMAGLVLLLCLLLVRHPPSASTPGKIT